MVEESNALTDDQLIQINHACNQFEKQWQNGLCPQTECFLEGAAPNERALLLQELLPLEVEYRRLSSEPLTVDECRRRFPDANLEWLQEILQEPPEDTQKYLDTHVPSQTPRRKSIANYELLETIGEGGFGVVYRAEQRLPMRRLVAVKLMKDGVDSKQIMARFEAERQALAIMDHPGIASIFDAGTTEEGRPYFVMELVRGIPITEYCDEYRLSVPERLRLFVSVCSAVQHAHQKGVIHRDIKPTNVLVAIHDGNPTPKVIDFGVAKAVNQRLTERTLRTGFAQMLGTPLYMSPEQAEMSVLDVDTRSDIYALGILLYELLTGSTPLEKAKLESAGFDEVRRLIREAEPPLPSMRVSTLVADDQSTMIDRGYVDSRRIAQALRGDLDWIVMKALEKDRTRRYSSAWALAEDVKRHLDDRPVHAGAPTLAYRISKFAKRNRRWMVSTCIACLTLVVAGALTIWQSSTASKARLERDLAQEQTAAVADFLVETFRRPDPSIDGRSVTIADVLEQAVDDLPRRFQDDSLNKARMLRALGETYLGLGLPKEATPTLEHSLRIYRQLLGEEDAETLYSASLLAQAYQDGGRIDDSIDLMEPIVERHAETGSEGLLDVESLLATSYAQRSQYDLAVELNKQVYEERRKSLGATHPDTLKALTQLGTSLNDAKRSQEAVAILEESVQLQAGREGPKHPETLESQYHLAVAYTGAGAQAKAIALHQSVLHGRQEVLGDDHFRTMESRYQYGRALFAMGNYEEAIAEYETLLSSPELITNYRIAALNNLGFSYNTMGQYDRAIEYWAQAVESLGAEDRRPVSLNVRFNLASAHGLNRQWNEAAQRYTELLSLESDLTQFRATQAMSRLGAIYASQSELGPIDAYIESMTPRFDQTQDSQAITSFAGPLLACPKIMQCQNIGDLMRLVEKPVPESYADFPYPQLMRGLAHLRNAKLDRAKTELESAIESTDVRMRLQAACYCAILESLREHPARAAELLSEARVLGERLPLSDTDLLTFQWHEDLLSRMAIQQATDIVESPQHPVPASHEE